MNKVEREILKKRVENAVILHQGLGIATECLDVIPELMQQIDALEDAARCRYEFEGSCVKGPSDGAGCCSCAA